MQQTTNAATYFATEPFQTECHIIQKHMSSSWHVLTSLLHSCYCLTNWIPCGLRKNRFPWLGFKDIKFMRHPSESTDHNKVRLKSHLNLLFSLYIPMQESTPFLDSWSRRSNYWVNKEWPIQPHKTRLKTIVRYRAVDHKYPQTPLTPAQTLSLDKGLSLSLTIVNETDS